MTDQKYYCDWAARFKHAEDIVSLLRAEKEVQFFSECDKEWHLFEGSGFVDKETDVVKHIVLDGWQFREAPPVHRIEIKIADCSMVDLDKGIGTISNPIVNLDRVIRAGDQIIVEIK